MTSRVKNWATRRKSGISNTPDSLTSSSSPQINHQGPTASPPHLDHSNSSQGSIAPMQRDSLSSRPPAYPYAPQQQNPPNTLNPPPLQPRTTSPVPLPLRTNGIQPPYPQSNGQPMYGQPPQYTPAPLQPSVYPGSYAQPPRMDQHPAYRSGAVEVEGAGRSKTALIVGIDFVGPGLLNFSDIV